MPKNLEVDSISINEYAGKVLPARRQQKVTDEDLMVIFNKLRDKWILAEDLKTAIGETIPVNVDNPKRSIISSGYLDRMSRITGDNWRQKTGFTPDGRRLVKVFTQGKYKKKE